MLRVVRVTFPAIKTQFYRMPDGRWLRFIEGEADETAMPPEYGRQIVAEHLGKEANYSMGWVNVRENHAHHETLIKFWTRPGQVGRRRKYG